MYYSLLWAGSGGVTAHVPKAQVLILDNREKYLLARAIQSFFFKLSS